MSIPSSTLAILARHPETAAKPEKNWSLDTIHLPPLSSLEPDELLIELVATGICHTDIGFTSVPEPNSLGVRYPKVAGHEGSGYVRAVGSNVTKVKEGDPVLLSIAFCGNCKSCKDGVPGFCNDFASLNFTGRPRYCTEKGGEEDVYGQFFGQSSFAQWSIVRTASVVNAKTLVRNEDDLKLFAPLGCGLQTGSGALLNAANATEKDTVLVMGLGGVGCAALMAAKVRGCRKIIGLDKMSSRMSLAKELGATHTIDTSNIKLEDVVEEVKKVTDGEGASVVIDTTGAPPLLDLALDLTARGGKLVFVGTQPPDYHFKFHAFEFMTSGRQLIACIEGNKPPEEPKQISELISYYREGKFPFDKLIKFSPAKEYTQAVHDMHSGAVVKPVLIW